jgi:hypothetical protein
MCYSSITMKINLDIRFFLPLSILFLSGCVTTHHTTQASDQTFNLIEYQKTLSSTEAFFSKKYNTSSIKNASGCPVIPPTQEELAKANYGSPISQEDAKVQATTFFKKYLKDPYSAKIEWGEVRKGWMREAPICDCELQFGYILVANVNAKNSFGGYVGSEPYKFFFKNGLIISINEAYKDCTVKYGCESQTQDKK